MTLWECAAPSVDEVNIGRVAALRGVDLNLADNGALDPQPSRWGYAVFGQIVEGMNVVDDIGAVATGHIGPFDENAPLKPIVIIRIEELK